MKGRKPKHIALKLLSGNTGGNKLAEADDPFVCGPVNEPAELDPLAAEEWARLTKALAPVLFNGSAGMLLVVCSAYSQFKSADRVIQEKGMTYETHGESGTVIRQRPEVRIRDAARTQYFRALSELGASPVSMVRVRKLPDKKNSKGKSCRHGAIFHLKGGRMQITPNQLDLACDLLWSREQLGGETYDEHDIERVAAAIAQRVWLERQMPEVFGFQAQYIYDPKYYLSPQSKRRRR